VAIREGSYESSQLAGKHNDLGARNRNSGWLRPTANWEGCSEGEAPERKRFPICMQEGDTSEVGSRRGNTAPESKELCSQGTLTTDTRDRPSAIFGVSAPSGPDQVGTEASLLVEVLSWSGSQEKDRSRLRPETTRSTSVGGRDFTETAENGAMRSLLRFFPGLQGDELRLRATLHAKGFGPEHFSPAKSFGSTQFCPRASARRWEVRIPASADADFCRRGSQRRGGNTELRKTTRLYRGHLTV